MRRPVACLGLCGIISVAAPGAALAGCAESIALLAKQVALIGDAAPLAADPNAPPGPPDTLVTLDNPALKSRTSTAFDVLGDRAAGEAGRADAFNARLSRARAGLAQAREALSERDLAACEDAVSMGLAAAMGARAAFR